MRLDLTDERPVFFPRHRLSRVEWDIMDSKVEELAEFGLIEPATGNYAATSVLPVKKDADCYYTDRRMCGDYRALNLKTKQDRYPMPILDNIFDRIESCQYFPIVDIRQGFNQKEMRSTDKDKTAFWVSNRRWSLNEMSFGLKNARACFPKFMDNALARHSDTKCHIYDILIHSRNFEEHLDHIRLVFEMIAAVGLKANPSKCVFGAHEVPYLGHLLSAKGVRPMKVKIKTIVDMPSPVHVTGVRSFLGLAGYFRKFVNNFSGLAKSLNGLT